MSYHNGRTVLAFLEYLRKPRKGEAGKVYLPKPIFVLGVVVVVLCLGVAVYTAFTNEELWIVLGFAAFSLLGLVLIIEYVNDRIFYDENGFLSKNFFGIKRYYTYAQVTAIRLDVHNRYVYLDDRKVTISEFAVGGKEFIAFVKEKYKELHDGKAVPAKPRNTNDLFHGNVKDVSSYVVAYVIMILFVLGFLTVTVVMAYFSPKSAENTVMHERIFDSCVSRGNEVELITYQEGYYKIRFTNHGFNPTAVREICDRKTRVTVYSEEITPDDAPAYYAVRAIVCDGEYVLSFDTTNELYSKEYRFILVFPIGLALLVAWFILKSIAVGRNPQNYSEQTVNRFFKKENLTI